MKQELKWVGWFFLALGIFALYAAVRMFTGGAVHAAGTSCRAVCGLAMLAALVFGEPAGSYVGGTFRLLVSSVFNVVGYRLMK